jgi:hypothetical protein
VSKPQQSGESILSPVEVASVAAPARRVLPAAWRPRNNGSESAQREDGQIRVRLAGARGGSRCACGAAQLCRSSRPRAVRWPGAEAPRALQPGSMSGMLACRGTRSAERLTVRPTPNPAASRSPTRPRVVMIHLGGGASPPAACIARVTCRHVVRRELACHSASRSIIVHPIRRVDLT